jgi:hypothetical protein
MVGKYKLVRSGHFELNTLAYLQDFVTTSVYKHPLHVRVI